MTRAHIRYREQDGSIRTLDVDSNQHDGQVFGDYDRHDGYITYKDGRGTTHLLPMHRIQEIEEA